MLLTSIAAAQGLLTTHDALRTGLTHDGEGSSLRGPIRHLGLHHMERNMRYLCNSLPITKEGEDHY